MRISSDQKRFCYPSSSQRINQRNKLSRNGNRRLFIHSFCAFGISNSIQQIPLHLFLRPPAHYPVIQPTPKNSTSPRGHPVPLTKIHPPLVPVIARPDYLSSRGLKCDLSGIRHSMGSVCPSRCTDTIIIDRSTKGITVINNTKNTASPSTPSACRCS